MSDPIAAFVNSLVTIAVKDVEKLQSKKSKTEEGRSNKSVAFDDVIIVHKQNSEKSFPADGTLLEQPKIENVGSKSIDKSVPQLNLGNLSSLSSDNTKQQPVANPVTDKEKITKVLVHYSEGDSIEANYRAKGKYYSGKIRNDRGNGCYDIDYDDGETEVKVANEFIRMKKEEKKILLPSSEPSEEKYDIGMKVEVNFEGKGKYFPGRISKLHEDNTNSYDIMYEDGERDTRVPSHLIRPYSTHSHAKSALVEATQKQFESRPIEKFELGEKVEVNFHSDGKYFTGRIRKVHENDYYDVMYEDGEQEPNILWRYIRPYTTRTKHSSLMEATQKQFESKPIEKFELGMKVEANFHGDGKYFPGRISKVHENDYYDVMYEDGEQEQNIIWRHIHPFSTRTKHSTLVEATQKQFESRPIEKFELGMKVEVNFHGDGKYFTGRIRKVHDNDYYDVMYEDGEQEPNILWRYIRPFSAHSHAKSALVEATQKQFESRPIEKFDLGMKVEVNFHGDGKYFPGRISKVHENSDYYDIMHEDGEQEQNILWRYIRPFSAHTRKSAMVEATQLQYKVDEEEELATAVISPQKWKEGDRIEANYRGKGKYYPGTVKKDRNDGTYDIDYDDGEIETRVKAENLRKVEEQQKPILKNVTMKFKEGDKIQGNYRSRGKFYPGVIHKVRSEGNYDIAYDDGEQETRVDESNIRSFLPSTVVGVSDKPRLEEEMKIEANYRCKGRYFPGKIRRDRGDGTFDIDYDDGESELKVKETDIRFVGGDNKSISDHKTKFEEGSKVEANYRSRERYFPGKVRRSRGDGTYDIDYDDGESELKVKESDIRLGEGDKQESSKPKLEEGMKVEANYRSRGRFFPGKIRRDRGDGTWDIDYDDGEQETRVDESNIRLVSSTAEIDATRVTDRPKLEEGMKIEANYRGKGRYFPGRIKKDRLDGTYDIDYDDGEQESRVKEADIRVLESHLTPRQNQSIEEGSRIEANYRGRGRFFPGKIRRNRGDGTYDIDYDDGESELKVKESDIRLVKKGKLESSSSKLRLEEGMKVEANYRCRGRFFPGKIRRDRGDGTFDIDYDDGESELKVKETDIRPLQVESPRERVPSNNNFKEGMKVEVNYRGRGKYYSGRILRDRGNGTWDIDYDDGEQETRVEEWNIRLVSSSLEDKGTVAGVTDKPRLEEGMKIEANYRSKGRYFPGRIKKDRLDGTYDIDYDDGEQESRVRETDIRILEIQAAPLPQNQDQSQDTIKFEEGARIEANYRGKGRYFPGTISRVRVNGSYDIDYDDGEQETRVAAEYIRASDEKKKVLSSDAALFAKFPIGSRIECKYRGKPKFYPGKVTSFRPNEGTYDVEYDDGEKELKVNEDNIRLLSVIAVPTTVVDSTSSSSSSGERFDIGMRVEVDFEGRGKFFTGRISKVHSEDNSYDIMYEDGERETQVKSHLIRLYSTHSHAKSALVEATQKQFESRPIEKFELGEKVEVNFHSDGKYFGGRISKVHENDFYDVMYEDGEQEQNILWRYIRPYSYSTRTKQSSLVEATQKQFESRPIEKFDLGMKVEVNFHGDGKYFTGRISKVHENDYYDVMYEDGEQEPNILWRYIRLFSAHSHAKSALVEATQKQFEPKPVDKFELGTKVEVNFKGDGKYFPGRIHTVQENDRYDILYDDGEQEYNIKSLMIRLPSSSSSRKSSPRAASVNVSRLYSEGDRIEADYRGKGKWYPGTIRRDRTDGSYDIDYEDGELETRVVERFIRKLVTTSTENTPKEEQTPTMLQSAASPPLNTAESTSGKHIPLKVGMNVEANYQGSGKFYSGKIISVDEQERTYGIQYHENNSNRNNAVSGTTEESIERNVPEECIVMVDSPTKVAINRQSLNSQKISSYMNNNNNNNDNGLFSLTSGGGGEEEEHEQEEPVVEQKTKKEEQTRELIPEIEFDFNPQMQFELSLLSNEESRSAPQSRILGPITSSSGSRPASAMTKLPPPLSHPLFEEPGASSSLVQESLVASSSSAVVVVTPPPSLPFEAKLSPKLSPKQSSQTQLPVHSATNPNQPPKRTSFIQKPTQKEAVEEVGEGQERNVVTPPVTLQSQSLPLETASSSIKVQPTITSVLVAPVTSFKESPAYQAVMQENQQQTTKLIEQFQEKKKKMDVSIQQIQEVKKTILESQQQSFNTMLTSTSDFMKELQQFKENFRQLLQ
jgi:uncharacterized protein (DUF427 family)